jgi:hypothetical protein
MKWRFKEPITQRDRYSGAAWQLKGDPAFLMYRNLLR